MRCQLVRFPPCLISPEGIDHGDGGGEGSVNLALRRGVSFSVGLLLLLHFLFVVALVSEGSLRGEKRRGEEERIDEWKAVSYTDKRDVTFAAASLQPSFAPRPALTFFLSGAQASFSRHISRNGALGSLRGSLQSIRPRTGSE